MIWHVLGLFAIIVIYNVARYFLLDDGDDKSPKREPEPKNNEENVTIMRWQGTDTCHHSLLSSHQMFYLLNKSGILCGRELRPQKT